MREFVKGMVLAAPILLVGASGLSANNFDGKWKGLGSSDDTTCPSFIFNVNVDDGTVNGFAQLPDQTLGIDGTVDAKGQFLGEVTTIGITVAELTGAIEFEKGVGIWQTVLGDYCEGTFAVERLPQ
ncbi:MAG: hypothetical protein AAF530_15590 [Pseudomonadota bacterium]